MNKNAFFGLLTVLLVFEFIGCDNGESYQNDRYVLTSLYYYGSNGELSQYNKYEYDSEGKQIKFNSYTANGELSGYGEFDYDSKGYQIRYYIYHSNGVLYQYMEYEYDSKGNLIKSYNYSALS